MLCATPPALHAPQAIELARRGLHLFVEKPMVLDAAEGERMLAAAAAEAGYGALVGEYRPTARNGMVAEHYARLGFEPVSEILTDVRNVRTPLRIHPTQDIKRRDRGVYAISLLLHGEAS